ncbi:probable G-protein coupled receptor 148 [Cynocephalus volans]|uniref:probable G-protein coupled receptor 148 n=1 Tax=Cynocephalus volans TaxID=110931 RepID=UPI002FC7695A
MGDELTTYHLGTVAWPAQIQQINKTPDLPLADNNTSLDLADLSMPISMLPWVFFPSSLLAAATLALNPLLLLTILRSQQLRQEPHYLLLANILLSDLVFVFFHTFICSSRLGGWELGRTTCGVFTDAVFIAHNSTILSFTATILHTYLAVTHPLHYLAFTSHGAAWKAVALIWLVACLFPTFLLWLGDWQDTKMEAGGALCILPLSLSPEPGCGPLVAVTHTCMLCVLFLCTAVITYCFWRIYAEAKTSGVWVQGCSRARGTLLIHIVLTTLYVTSGVVFSLDVLLTKNQHIGSRMHVWLLAANSQVLVMLPRAMLPYMYVLRYRRLLGVVRGHFSAGRQGGIFTISQSCRAHNMAG